MNDKHRLDRLLDRARDDRPEPIDVTARVMARVAAADDDARRASLRTLPAGRTWRARWGLDTPLLAMTGVSVGAAAVVALLAMPYMDALFDSMLGLFQGVDMVMR